LAEWQNKYDNKHYRFKEYNDGWHLSLFPSGRTWDQISLNHHLGPNGKIIMKNIEMNLQILKGMDYTLD